MKDYTLQALLDQFIEIFGGDSKDLRAFSAPGRVNLIGEHTDYNGGYVFPGALTFTNIVIARKRQDDCIKLAVTSLPNRVTASTQALDSYRDLPWGNYQLGVAYMLQQAGYAIPGCELLYHGTVPYGGGLSSSASIEVVTAIALLGLSDQTMDKTQIALIGQKAENEYCGMNCGIMDQYAAAHGKADHAILLDCNELTHRYVPLHLDGYELVVTNTNKPHNLIQSKYNQRRAQCEQAVLALQTELPQLKLLCELTPQEFEKHAHLIEDEVVYRRAKHAIYENARCKEAVDALEQDDLVHFGKLMCASHESLRDDYEVTGKELDALYDAAKTIDGCIGVRMTGGGFGGCTVAIVKQEAVPTYQEQVSRAYTQKTGFVPTFYVCRLGEGGREIAIR